MNTTDEFGNPIYVLPECAYCVLKGAFLDTFEDCPSCQFDSFGDRCIPALCEFYDELWSQLPGLKSPGLRN